MNIANDLVSKTYDSHTVDDKSSFKRYMPEFNGYLFEDSNFQVDDIKYFISTLNNSKSTYFAPRVLKLISEVLSPVLTAFFKTNVLRIVTFQKNLK